MQVAKSQKLGVGASTRAGPDSGFLMESPMASITLGDDDCHARRLRSFQADRN